MSRSVDIKNVRTGDCSLDYFTFGNGDRAFVILPGISLRSVMLSASAVAEAYSCLAGDFNAYDELDKVQCDALVLGAWNDAVTAPAGSPEIAEKLGCPLYMYPGYSHAVFDEAPDFKARVLEFFR